MAYFDIKIWVGFSIFAIFAILCDLYYFGHRKKGGLPTFTQSLVLTGLWVTLSMVFCLIIYMISDAQLAVEYLTGYVVELSLSMDNVFVFILIFSYFMVPKEHQHKVLFYGILGAIFMRLGLIYIGVNLIQRFIWIFYVFGLLMLYSAYKIVTTKHTASEISDNGLIRLCRKFFPVSQHFDGGKFFTMIKGKRHMTPLFIALLAVEKTDLVFALDSIPAILAITQEPFIVFTSNVFAIIGLRSLYFVLANLIARLKYLHYGLAIILFYIGCKMILLVHHIHIPTLLSLSIVFAALIGSGVASVVYSKGDAKQ